MKALLPAMFSAGLDNEERFDEDYGVSDEDDEDTPSDDEDPLAADGARGSTV